MTWDDLSIINSISAPVGFNTRLLDQLHRSHVSTLLCLGIAQIITILRQQPDC
uniref:Uncharacterized protein n=1 Tax=Rhizophora mucronata TaxID=61149 RepID=A0A2P2P7L5_RHIMU